MTAVTGRLGSVFVWGEYMAWIGRRQQESPPKFQPMPITPRRAFRPPVKARLSPRPDGGWKIDGKK
jgi:hypothetical protein